jgi:hypothetical protein
MERKSKVTLSDGATQAMNQIERAIDIIRREKGEEYFELLRVIFQLNIATKTMARGLDKGLVLQAASKAAVYMIDQYNKIHGTKWTVTEVCNDCNLLTEE